MILLVISIGSTYLVKDRSTVLGKYVVLVPFISLGLLAIIENIEILFLAPLLVIMIWLSSKMED